MFARHSVNELQMFEWLKPQVFLSLAMSCRVRKLDMGKLVEQLITRWAWAPRSEVATVFVC